MPRKKLPSMHLTGMPLKNTILIFLKKEKDEKEDKRKQRHLKKFEVSKTKSNKHAKIATKKKKLVKRHLDFRFTESEDSTHAFEVPHVDTDNDQDPEDLDNQACIICGGIGKTELWFQCFMYKLSDLSAYTGMG
ncbi:hypothetical protein AVEN_19786-1 [Araneus ventricosus]|uniref:Uncharacterized protein n=1 Tax=Araneus ventricosus TaxID=182803 RepID=A0A4Y2HBX1_ARAVE|nr:hypothetical protein AVEN_19786-1 [Araneus ventricosus]